MPVIQGEHKLFPIIQFSWASTESFASRILIIQIARRSRMSASATESASTRRPESGPGSTPPEPACCLQMSVGNWEIHSAIKLCYIVKRRKKFYTTLHDSSHGPRGVFFHRPREMVVCPICVVEYGNCLSPNFFSDTNNVPKSLPCGHVFCSDCFDRLRAEWVIGIRTAAPSAT